MYEILLKMDKLTRGNSLFAASILDFVGGNSQSFEFKN